MLMEDLTTEELKDAMRKGESYFCYEPKGSGEGKAPRISSIAVDEIDKTITIQANGLVYWIYGTDKTSTAASSTRSSVVGIGNTFNYSGFQGSYVRAFITNVFGETCTQPFSFADERTVDVENVPMDNGLVLLLYPNPAEAYLNVFMNVAEYGERINVYDINGKLLINTTANGAVTTVPVQSLSAGMYMVQVGTRIGKFFKE